MEAWKGTPMRMISASPAPPPRSAIFTRATGPAGELPKWEIAFGNAESKVAITSFSASDIELEPLAAKLRTALAELRPSGA